MNTSKIINSNNQNVSDAREIGHKQNVANLKQLINYCEGYGSKYAPLKNSLKIPALWTLQKKAESSINDVIEKTKAYYAAINSRKLAFARVKILSTRIVNELNASECSQDRLKKANFYNRWIQHVSIVEMEMSLNLKMNLPRSIKHTQDSYHRWLNHLGSLLWVLKSEPAYSSKEEDLSIENIRIYIDSLIDKNAYVAKMYTEARTARMIRDRTLYSLSTGLIFIAAYVKVYVKLVFGIMSPQYKQIKKIPFKKVRDSYFVCNKANMENL